MNSPLQQLGLGTVQFGTEYGIANRAGKPSTQESVRIIAKAVNSGFGYIDTAASYGNAEELVGMTIRTDSAARIVTKTPAYPNPQITAEDGELLLESLAQSLKRLRRKSVYALLVHHGSDLLKPGADYIIDALEVAQARGLTEKIGYSAYNPLDIQTIQKVFQGQIIQAPLSILDQRMITTGMLATLKAQNISFHARSMFLQGLLLMSPASVPANFGGVQKHLMGLHQHLSEHGLSPLEGCLGFAMNCHDVEATLVGVQSADQLEEIYQAAEASKNIDFEPWAISDDSILDPSKWNRDLIH